MAIYCQGLALFGEKSMSMKYNIALLVLAIVFMFCYVAHHGRLVRAGHGWALGHHVGGTNCLMYLGAITMVLVEILLMTERPFGPSRPPIFWVHLAASSGFFAIFVAMRFIFTGVAYSSVHRRLFRIAAACFAVSLATGLVMFYRF